MDPLPRTAWFFILGAMTIEQLREVAQILCEAPRKGVGRVCRAAATVDGVVFSKTHFADMGVSEETAKAACLNSLLMLINKAEREKPS